MTPKQSRSDWRGRGGSLKPFLCSISNIRCSFPIHWTLQDALRPYDGTISPRTQLGSHWAKSNFIEVIKIQRNEVKLPSSEWTGKIWKISKGDPTFWRRAIPFCHPESNMHILSSGKVSFSVSGGCLLKEQGAFPLPEKQFWPLQAGLFQAPYPPTRFQPMARVT